MFNAVRVVSHHQKPCVRSYFVMLSILMAWLGFFQCLTSNLEAQKIEKYQTINDADGSYKLIACQPYKSGLEMSDYERERCILDLYLPTQESNFPVIIYFHGGSLKKLGKDNSFNQEVGKHFAKKGIAAAIVNYRLSPKVNYPAYIEDAAASVAWIKKHIDGYGGNNRAMFIVGHSAGGYLAYMLAMDHRYLNAVGISSEELAGIISLGGQTFTHYTVREERGLPNPETTPIIDEASPCFHARKDSPPVLAIYGDGDSQDRKEENHYFIALLQKVGHRNASCVEIKEHTHWELVTKIPDNGNLVSEAIINFIENHNLE